MRSDVSRAACLVRNAASGLRCGWLLSFCVVRQSSWLTATRRTGSWQRSCEAGCPTTRVNSNPVRTSIRSVLTTATDQCWCPRASPGLAALDALRCVSDAACCAAGVEAFLQPYADFLQVHGHAVLAGMDVGGRYQEWAYMDSALQSPARVMLLRACAQAVRLAGGSAVGGCSGAATGGSQQGAQHPAEMLSVRMAPQDTEGRLAGGLSPAGLAAFLAAAARQSVAVRRRFVAVWDALAPYYRQLCDPGSAEYFSMRACAALQRLGNLEAAYEGLLVRRCRRLETSDSLAYQGMMAVEGDGGAGAHALVRFRCAVLQAGCTRHRDCRAAAPGRCYCYGSSCIAAAAEVPFSAPPRRYASVQREQGSADPRQEPNDSCYWLAPSRVCRCKLADGNYYSPSQAGDDGTPLITLWQQITG